VDKLIFAFILMGLASAACSILAYSRISRYLPATFVSVAAAMAAHMAGWMLWGGVSLESEQEGWWLALAILSGMSLLVTLPIVLTVGLVFLVKRRKRTAASPATVPGVQDG